LSSWLLSRNIKFKIHKTMTLPVVLYGCKIWSLTLWEQHRQWVLRIFGPKWAKVMGEWRKLHNGELHTLYLSPNIIRQIKSKIMRWHA
jgi:hypothetical protein